MNTGISDDRYALIQRLLHWLIALIVLGMLISGWIILEFGRKDFPKGVYSQIYDLHKSAGVIALVLMLLRVVVRLIHGAPAPHPALTSWQRSLSSIVHHSFYLLLIIQPILGLVGTWTFPAPVPILDALGVDNPFSKDRDLSGTLFFLHEIVGKALTALVVLHLCGAFMHIFKRDGVFRRMGLGR